VNCTRCSGEGFINLHQIPDAELAAAEASSDFNAAIVKWIEEHEGFDVQVCDCCGDGDDWHGDPGEHDENVFGRSGPYGYNGGFPECY
jgi:hypothetical protein